MAETCPKSRILDEKLHLSEHFEDRNIRWNQSWVELDVKTFSDKAYTLRLYIPEDFPNSYPQLAVVKPQSLSIPLNKPSFHTLGKHDGFQTILHYLPDVWHHGYHIYQIFKKGRMWIRAYEDHLATGRDIDELLRVYVQQSSGVRIWSDEQRRRLRLESEILQRFFPGVDQVDWSEDQRSVNVRILSHRRKNEYTLSVRINEIVDFPNSPPELSIVSPRELYTVNGEPVPENSQEFRTLERDSSGRLRICHFGPSEWLDSIYLTTVFTKGQTWVNAYECYLMKEGEVSFLDCLRGACQEGDSNMS